MYIASLPGTGMTGWSHLKRTEESQIERLNATARVREDLDYAREKLTEVDEAEDLLDDRRLLRIVLTAHGMEDRINDRGLLQQVLSQGAEDDSSLANRLADTQMIELADRFDFDQGLRALDEKSISALLQDYSQAQFSGAVADQDEGLGVALRARNAFSDLAEEEVSSRARWFKIVGDDNMRSVMETVLQLSKSTWGLDIDSQVDRLEKSFSQRFGEDISALSDEGFRDSLMDRYVAMDKLSAISTMSSASIALALFS